MKPRFVKSVLPRGKHLTSAGLEDRAFEFYELAPDGAWIRCRICGFVTDHPKHVRQKYCPVCRVFHEDRMLMARLAEGYQTRFTWRRPADQRWKTAP